MFSSFLNNVSWRYCEHTAEYLGGTYCTDTTFALQGQNLVVTKALISYLLQSEESENTKVWLGREMEKIDKGTSMRKYWICNCLVSSKQNQISILELTWTGITQCTICFLITSSTHQPNNGQDKKHATISSSYIEKVIFIF